MRNLRTRFLCSASVTFLLALTFVFHAHAASTDFTPTTSGTFDSNASGNWDNGRPTNTGLDDNFTMSFSGAITVTNFLSTGGGSLNFVRLSTAGSGTLTVISSAGFDSAFGLQLNNNDTLIIANNSTISHGNNAFGDSGGTLIASNSASVFINIGANAVQNTGTIQLTSATGQTSDINYGQSTGGAFNNSGTGTIIKNGTGTGTFVGNFGTFNIGFVNNGTMIVNSGTLVVDPRNAFTSPFANAGTITVNSGGNFVISRTGGAWSGGNAPSSSGTIFLNGGTLGFLVSDSANASGQAATNFITNTGNIIGNGTLAGSVSQGTTGNTIASNGVLNIFGTFNGGQATFTSSGGQFGTMKAVSGGTLKVNGAIASGNAASWVVNSGGTLEIAANADLGHAFKPGSQLNGTIQIDSGDNLTMSAATGTSGQTWAQNGTFAFNGGTILMPNTTGQQAFTNAGTFVTVGGNGTFQSGFGSGNQNYGFVNSGTVLANDGGTMSFISSDANSMGFSNMSSGSIVVSNASWLKIDRTAAAWTNANSAAVANQGTIVLNNGTLFADTAGVLDTTRILFNSGTIFAQGTGTGTNTWQAGLANAGTLYITNNGAVFNLLATTSGMTNSAGAQVLLGGVGGTVGTMIATNMGAGGGAFLNQGLVQGQGTLTLGVANDPRGSGSSANFVNTGNLVATNWGGAAAGTLFISVGNAASNGGFSNAANGSILIASNTTLTVNRTENAWANSANSVANAGTITMAGGTLNLAADGIVSNAASFINTGLITGNGTINSVVLTTNGGKMLAVATNLTSVGTLTARIASTTNNSTATLGVIGTKSVLNIITPGGQNVLLNFGTISLSGGSINFNGGTGTITNFNVIAGVGNVSSFPIVNAGTLASFVAQGPISGLSNLIASVGVTNTGVLGANNLLGGAATLTLGTSTGGGLVNNGTMAVQGGFITVTNAAGVDAGITNLTGLVYGSGAQNFSVVNLSGGTLLASNGILRLGMSGANAGVVSNFNSVSTIILTNTILRNTGTIALNGGGLIMGGSVITNQGLFVGPGEYSSGLYNDTNGTVLAAGGTLEVATNGAGEAVSNLGTVTIANGSTLNLGVATWSSSGLVANAGGVLGSVGAGVTVLTNSGIIVNSGTIAQQLWNTGSITNTSGTFARSITNSTGGFIQSAGGSFSGGTFANLGGTFVATNANVNILATTVINTGTMVGGTGAGVIMTNLTANLVNQGTMILRGALTDPNASFDILRTIGGSGDFTNAVGGLIEGAGFFATGDFIPGSRNFTIWNEGTILATNGSLILQPADAFNSGGFVNQGGTVIVANASSFGLQRSSNAWVNSGTVPINAGLIQMNGGSLAYYADGLTLINDRSLSNAPSGVISGFGTLMSSVNNLGTVAATNGNLNINNGSAITQNGTVSIANGATLTVLGSAGSFQNNGQMALSGGTFIGTNFSQLANAGTIRGFGTIQTGRLNGSGGANQQIVNMAGALIDTTNGTLFLNSGDAFSNGGFSNAATAAVRVENNATLALNRTANAWNNSGLNPRNLGTISLQGGSVALYADGVADASRFIDNVSGSISGTGTISASLTNLAAGTIRATGGTLALQGTGAFGQQGTLQTDAGATLLISNVNGLASFKNAGTVDMNGGTLVAGIVSNANWIFGSGVITGNAAAGIVNLSNSFLFASNGVLSASLGSFTNGIGVTMGTLSTDAVLNVQMPGGASQSLINQGLLSFAGGTLLANGTGSGVITNTSTGVISGVGNVTQTVVNNGTILATGPVGALNTFSVGLSALNSATLGASNGAILNAVINGGAGNSFNNNGSISMIGGTLIISNATPGIITNNFFVSGVGTITPNIVNNGTVQATVSSGVLDFSLLGGTNGTGGYIGAGSGAVAQLENGSVINLGTIGAVGGNGGTIQLATSSGIITNRALITGNGNLAVNSFIQNDPVGRLTATNGTLTVNAINGLANNGTIDVENSGTFQSNSSNSWSNAGNIDMRGGTLRTGGFTNAAVGNSFTNSASGIISGYGTLIGGGAFGQTGSGFDKSIINLGLIIATNPLSGTAQTLFISTGGATTGGGIRNLGTMIVSSNNTLALDRGGLPVLNTGTITINNGTLSTTSTLTNTLNGIIQGYGTLTAGIVNQSGGTIRATNGLLTMTSAVFPVNQGTFEIDNGATMTWDTSNSWINSGTVDLRGGTLRTGGATNAGVTAIFTNLNTIIGSGTVYGGGAFNTNGVGIDKSIVNIGTVIASNGVLTLNTGVATSQRGLANLGTMIIATTNDTLVLARTAEVTPTLTNLNYVYNSGTILINGGTLTSDTSVTNNDESISLPGLIQGFGTIALTNQLVNLGTIRSTNSAAGGDGILRFVNPAGSALQINQGGTLVVEGGSQMIFGGDTNAPLLNSGTIVMNGGILSSGQLTNSFGATFRGFGTITSSIINSGTGLATSLSAPLHLTGSTVFNQASGVLGANGGGLIVDTVFTNAGTVSFINSVGTFNSAVVNKGAWVMDPSTNVFLSDYTVATNGYVSMAAGDVSIFKSNFVNVSTLSNQYNTVNGKFVMAGQGTQQFYVAGVNLGGYGSSLQSSNEQFFTTGSGTFSTNSFLFGVGEPAFGYSNNFALGALELSDLSTTVVMDAFGTVGTNDGLVAGLYLNNLTLDPGSLLIISNNVELYFQSTNGVTGVGLGVLGAGDNILILNGGSFHQLTAIPEPSILMLLTVGAFAILKYRRWSGRKQV